MLLTPKRNKLRIWKIGFMLLSFMLVMLGMYAVFAWQGQAIITPLAEIAVSKASDVTSLLTFFHISFTSISQASDLSFDIRLANGAQVLMTPKKDLNFQASSLQQMIKQLTIEGKQLEKIDFRFDKPVIVFK